MSIVFCDTLDWGVGECSCGHTVKVGFSMADEVVDSSTTVVDDSPASSSARTEPTNAAVEHRADIRAASKRILRSSPNMKAVKCSVNHKQTSRAGLFGSKASEGGKKD